MSWSLRPLTAADDLDAFGRLVLGSYQGLDGHPHDAEYDAELADVRSRVARATVIGALDDDEPLGCVTYVDGPGSPFAEQLRPGETSFRMLAVGTAAQGRGVGEALVTACLDTARDAGGAATFIFSGSWMSVAHRLYGRLGFERVPERDWLIEDAGVRLLGFIRSL
jgi:ribosomal protein S18 acetylase RimI-like enzyme